MAQSAGTRRWYLTAKQLCRGMLHSVPELMAAIDAYMTQRNAQPQPFVWTKPAQEILGTHNEAGSSWIQQEQQEPLHSHFDRGALPRPIRTAIFIFQPLVASEVWRWSMIRFLDTRSPSETQPSCQSALLICRARRISQKAEGFASRGTIVRGREKECGRLAIPCARATRGRGPPCWTCAH